MHPETLQWWMSFQYVSYINIGNEGFRLIHLENKNNEHFHQNL